MAARLVALCFDAYDPLRLAQFWAGVLGGDVVDDRSEGRAVLPSEDIGFRIRFTADPAAQDHPEPACTST